MLEVEYRTSKMLTNNTEKESIELQNAVNTLGRNSFQPRNAGNSIQKVSNPESKN